MKIRTEARRDAILQIAAEVFLEKGFECASMAEIAQKVGGSKATLYGYFPSKEALFLAVAQAEGQKQMEAAGAELMSSGPAGLAPALTRFAEALLRFLGAETTCACHRMVIAEAGRSDIGKLFYDIGPKHGLDLIADVMGSAPLLADHLSRYPNLLDGVLTAGFIHDRFKPQAQILTESGNRFLRLTNSDPAKTVFADQRIRIDPTWKALNVSARMRATNFRSGGFCQRSDRTCTPAGRRDRN